MRKKKTLSTVVLKFLSPFLALCVNRHPLANEPFLRAATTVSSYYFDKVFTVLRLLYTGCTFQGTHINIFTGVEV
jgi:hypothetical protein